jgi:hypothetical protein
MGNLIRFDLVCNICNKIVPFKNLKLEEKEHYFFICVECECGNNNILWFDEKRCLKSE